MKEKLWNQAGSRMTNFESDHKTFNGYIVSVTRGNVIGGGQYSSFVRRESDTKCNGFDFEPGALRRADLKHFNISLALRSYLDNNPDKYIILYEFYHYSHGKKTTHGHVVQSVDRPGEFQLFRNPYTTWKSYSVLQEAVKFLN
jgi:hypothetical protein